MIEEYKPGLK